MSFKAGSIYGEAILDTKKWDAGIKSVGKSALNVAKVSAAAFVGAMTVSIAKANNFQKAMSNVATVVDTSVVSTQDLSKQLLKMDPALGNTTELTNALYQSFSAGADTAAEAMATTTAAATFAGAALTDTATAVNVLTTASNAYGKDLVSTTQASDIFFTTIKQGKINGEQLSASIGKSIPLFASLNIPLEELGAGMAAMTKQGISASESTTQLNGIINSFLKPSDAMIAALNEQGIASGSALLESEGLSGALEFLETASGGSKDELSKLLPSIEAVRGTLALTGVGGEEFSSILAEMANSAGSTSEAFDKQEKTFETLKNNLDQIAIVSGNVGKHFVDKIAVGAITAGKGMMDFIMSARGMEVVATVAEIAGGAFELLKTGIEILVDNLLPPLNELWITVTNSISKVTGETEAGAGGMQLFSWAIEAVSTGIVLLSKVAEIAITSIVDLVLAVKASAGAVGSFFDMITGKVSFSEVKEQFSAAGDAFKSFGKNAAAGFGDLIQETKDQFSGFGEKVRDTTLEISTSVKTTAAASREYVLSNWDAMITGQTDFLGEYLEGEAEIETVTEETSDVILEDNLSLIGKLKAAWSSYFEESKFSWSGLYETVTSTIGSALSSWSDLSSQYYTNEEAKQENSYNEQLEALQANYDNGIISETEFEEQSAILEADALEKKNVLAEKQFKTQKAMNIANVWMNAASSIAGWWSQAPLLGPIAGTIWAGTMTGLTLGMGAAQTALIGAQEFVPARQYGGMAGGLTRVNEAGGEIISLPDGSQVIPNDISSQIANNSAGSGSVVNFYDTIINDPMDIDDIADKVSRAVAGRTRIA